MKIGFFYYGLDQASRFTLDCGAGGSLKNIALNKVEEKIEEVVRNISWGNEKKGGRGEKVVDCDALEKVGVRKPSTFLCSLCGGDNHNDTYCKGLRPIQPFFYPNDRLPHNHPHLATNAYMPSPTESSPQSEPKLKINAKEDLEEEVENPNCESHNGYWSSDEDEPYLDLVSPIQEEKDVAFEEVCKPLGSLFTSPSPFDSAIHSIPTPPHSINEKECVESEDFLLRVDDEFCLEFKNPLFEDDLETRYFHNPLFEDDDDIVDVLRVKSLVEEDLNDNSLVCKPYDASESFYEVCAPILPSRVPFSKGLHLIPSSPILLPHYVTRPPLEGSSISSASHALDSHVDAQAARLYSSDKFSSFYVDSSLYFDSSSSSYFLIFPSCISYFSHFSSHRHKEFIYHVPMLLCFLAYVMLIESFASAFDKHLRSLQSYLLDGMVSTL